jgi:uncharacterized membrane protein
MSEPTPQFPLAAPAFDGKSRAVAAGNGFDWIKQGWALFVASPAQWLLLTLVLLIVVLGLYIVPFVGTLALDLATPIIMAGMLRACRKVAAGGTPELADLSAGLSSTPLVVLGVVYAAATMAIVFVVTVLAGGSVSGGMATGPVTGLGVALGGAMLALLLAAVLSLPVMMAIWFAPALVIFNDMGASAALKASFAACVKNGLSLTVYSVFLLVLSFFALLPVGLGLLVLIPVFFGSLYASYRDVFVAD